MNKANILEEEVTVTNPRGLHMRASGKLMSLANSSKANLYLICGKRTIDARSMLDIMTLAAAPGTKLTIRIQAAGDSEADLKEAQELLAKTKLFFQNPEAF